VSLVPQVFTPTDEDMAVRELHTSSGRFLEVTINAHTEWGETVTARAILDAADVRAAIEAFEEWLSSLGFSA